MRVLLIHPREMAIYQGTRFEFKRTQECVPPLNLAVLALRTLFVGQGTRLIGHCSRHRQFLRPLWRGLAWTSGRRPADTRVRPRPPPCLA